MSLIAVALGGHILGVTPKEQALAIRKVVIPIADLIELGHDVILVHGCGPQIKMMYEALTSHSIRKGWGEEISLADCIAYVQGGIGFRLQNSLAEELKGRGIQKQVVTVLTRMVVDQDDPAFRKKTKHIGLLGGSESPEDSDLWAFSPKPVQVLEKEILVNLLKEGTVLIAGGGGGVPVFVKEAEYTPVNAVIDKDAASCVLADALDADYLFILTGISKVALFYGSAKQQNLKKMSVLEAEEWMRQGHFSEGSMLPKVQASLQFVKGKTRRRAIITSLEKSRDAILGKDGTIIYDSLP